MIKFQLANLSVAVVHMHSIELQSVVLTNA